MLQQLLDSQDRITRVFEQRNRIHSSSDVAPYTLDVCQRAAAIAETRAARQRLLLEQIAKVMHDMFENFTCKLDAPRSNSARSPG